MEIGHPRDVREIRPVTEPVPEHLPAVEPEPEPVPIPARADRDLRTVALARDDVGVIADGRDQVDA